ncbi:mitochondrial carrier protein [Moelleriella libera RCEF 2490]|uniref:Mitochondrial carrier protein n=1 Tax=Moelleriella libera RCEF 2490 TaxID=1081109 RepID=A0A166NUH9_9HYPO|nr:mitochondrial carrier protein [Moelleriella libera RCEF 2490]
MAHPPWLPQQPSPPPPPSTWPSVGGSGVLPVVANPDDYPDRAPRSNAATAASAAGVRALSAQLVTFYFRAPAKAFFRTRVDYLAYARTVHHAQIQRMLAAVARDAGRRSWPTSASAPAKATKRVYPPPSPPHTFTAGLLAGALQSLVAAPLDALQARYDHHDLMPPDRDGNQQHQQQRRPTSMWRFGAEKLREIGLRGIFAGWGLSLAKDSLGSAVFFSTFEYVKAQGYYRFVTWYYGGLGEDVVDLIAMKRPTTTTTTKTSGGGARFKDGRDEEKVTLIRPHYAIEPMFLFMAGFSASFAQQLLLHPLTHFQVKHWDHLEDLDAKAAKYREAAVADATRCLPQETSHEKRPRRRWRMLRAYYRAYRETWTGCRAEASAEGLSLTKWLYRGFWWNTIRQVPSTSAGLIIFELIRRKYGYGAEEVRITKDGYDILLN